MIVFSKNTSTCKSMLLFATPPSRLHTLVAFIGSTFFRVQNKFLGFRPSFLAFFGPPLVSDNPPTDP